MNPLPDAGRFGRSIWPWLLLRGLLALALGVIALFFPLPALVGLTLVFAAFAAGDGIVSLIAGIRDIARRRSHGWLLALRGVVGIAVGAIFVAMPMLATVSYALLNLVLISIWFLVAGLLELVIAMRLRQALGAQALLVVSGLLSIGLGILLPIVLLRTPGTTLVSVAWMIGFYAIIAGTVLTVHALRLWLSGRHQASGLAST